MPAQNNVGSLSSNFGALGGPFVILLTGDSHHNGRMSNAPLVPGDSTAIPVPTGPFDTFLYGDGTIKPITSANIDVAPALMMAINPTYPNTDPNVGSAANPLTMGCWIPPALRAGRNFGNIILVNCGYGGTSSYTWSGNCAVGFTACNANPNDGDQFIVNGRPYTYRNVLAAPDDIKIGATKEASALNFWHAINLDGTAGAYGPGTTANVDFFSPNQRADQYVFLTSRHVGAAGNLVVSGTGNCGMLQAIGGGTNIGCFPDNANKLLAKANLTPNLIIHSIGTNDTGAAGWNCSNFREHQLATIDNWHALYPNALVGMNKPPHTSVLARNNLISTVINPDIDAIAAIRSFTFVIDAWDIPTLIDGVPSLSNDGIHLTNIGYKYWGNIDGQAALLKLPH